MPPAQSAASDSALLLAASFRLQIKDYDEAESLVSRLIASNGQPQTPLQHQAQVRGGEEKKDDQHYSPCAAPSTDLPHPVCLPMG
jgi:hypothetical protein